MEPVIRARSLTKLYGIVVGINDVTIDVSPGIHGLLGPNGAGKSTFLKIVTGQLAQSEGDLFVFGERPWNNPKLFRRIGFCPEQDAFYGFLTGVEFVAALARMNGMGRREARSKAEGTMERVGGAEFMHRKIRTYSKGMRQRTKIAQALVHDPDLLILDEPLTGTDPIGRRELMSLVRDLGAEGRCILISSHVLHEVESMTKNFLLIYRGRILASGNVEEIRGLMNEYPHRIRIRAEGARGLAVEMMKALPISGLEIDAEEKSVTVRTRDPRTFYEKLPEVAVASGASIREIHSEDDDLDAVFHYLVAGKP